MSALEDAIRAVATANAQDFLCKQITKNQEFTRKVVPDPFGTYKVLTDIQGSLLRGILECPNDIDSNKVFSQAPQFQGGQCTFAYNVNYSFQGGNTGIGNGSGTANSLPGPIGPGVTRGTSSPPNGVEIGFSYNGGSSFFQISVSSDPDADFTCQVNNVTPSSGQPDNCGSLPNDDGQIDGTYDELPVLDQSETTINYDFTYDFGGDIGEKTINLPFSNLTVDASRDFEFSFDVGGIRFHSDDTGVSEEDPKDTQDKDKGKRDKLINEALDKANELLEEIEECVCDDEPQNEIENVNLPVAICTGDEGDKSAAKSFQTLQVLKDSVTPTQLELFDMSADLGLEGCTCTNFIEQENAMELYTATTSQSQQVIFSPEIPSEVRAVVVEINSYDPLEIRVYKLAGNQSEAKFGFAHISIDQFDSGGDPQYLWTRQTYFRLPASTKPIRLRISAKPGTNFTIWDTGERGQLSLPPASAA